MFDFPSSGLTVGQVVTGPNGTSYKWDGVKWVSGVAAAVGNYLPLVGGTLTGPMTITPTAAGNSTINLNDAAGNTRQLNFETAGSMRWQINTGSLAEGGSNAGSNLNILNYSDTGVALGTAVSINRATGATSIGEGGLNVNGVAPGGNVTYAFPLSVNAPAGNASLIAINGQAGANKGLTIQTNGNYRWTICAESSPESGSNVGSDLGFFSYPDTGNTATKVLEINRATGVANFFGNNVYLTSPSGIWSELYLQKPASGVGSQIIGQTGANRRWSMCFGDSGAESGSNAGSDFQLYRYNDAGTNQGSCLSIYRSNGNANFTGNVTAPNVTGSSAVNAGNYQSSGGNSGYFTQPRGGSGPTYGLYADDGNSLHIWQSNSGNIVDLSSTRAYFNEGIVAATAPQLRMVPNQNYSASSYGSMWYNDGGNTYLLLTNNNDAFGTWNGLRPFYVTDSNGYVYMNQGVSITGGLTVDSISSGTLGNYLPLSGGTCSGYVYMNGGLTVAGNGIRYSSLASNQMGLKWVGNATQIIVDGSYQGTINTSSDGGRKANLGGIEVDPLADVLQIKLQSYDQTFIEGEQSYHYPIGMIAQNLLKIGPDMVDVATEHDPETGEPTDETSLGVILLPLISRLVGSIQQLSARVEALELAMAPS